MSGLEQVLQNLLVPDTAVIQEATRQLKEICKDPKVIAELCNLMQNSANSQVRQYASVLLRKKLQKYWTKLPKEEKDVLKVTLIQALLSEQIHFVRSSIAQIVGEIGKTEIPANQWPEILQLLQVTLLYTVINDLITPFVTRFSHRYAIFPVLSLLITV